MFEYNLKMAYRSVHRKRAYGAYLLGPKMKQIKSWKKNKKHLALRKIRRSVKYSECWYTDRKLIEQLIEVDYKKSNSERMQEPLPQSIRKSFDVEKSSKREVKRTLLLMK